MLAEIEKALGEGTAQAVVGRPAVTLADEAGARALAALCRERGWCLHPWASGELPSPDLPADTALVTPGPGLTGEFALAADDYYCEAPAPTTLGELEGKLEGTPLWLPFAAPAGAAMALGELIARYPANAFAPAYGELHRLLFGLSFINDDGELVSTGRRTIKGVAGYDLSKLFLGSRGRAGLITRVRLRLFRRPAEAVFWRTRGATPDDAVSGGCVCRLDADGEALLYADGHPGDVDAAAERLRRAMPDLAEVSRGDAASRDFAAAVAALPYRPPAEPPAAPAFSDLYI
jgi:glycolate oxidase FAD binding subunit